MEPPVVNALQLARLFQTGVLVIDGSNKDLIITYDMQLARRNILYLVKYKTVEG